MSFYLIEIWISNKGTSGIKSMAKIFARTYQAAVSVVVSPCTSSIIQTTTLLVR